MTIEKMPSSAILIYTDGSTLEDHSSGSGVYIEIPGSSPPISLSIKNSKHTNNYAAELIANIEGLQTMINNDEEDRRDLHPDRLQVIRADSFLPGKSISPYSYTHSETGYWLLIIKIRWYSENSGIDY